MSVSIPTSNNKSELRRRLREQRRALSPAARRLAAEKLADHLCTSRAFRVSRRVACYLPVDSEIDTAAVIERLSQLNKRCYLPVISRIDHDRLWFAPATDATRHVANRYGIHEPRVPARQLIRAQELDLVLLPLVGFDERGYRLGMGGGFYDRSLAFLAQREYWRKPHLIGLAYDFQKLAALPHEPWDIPLDAIATDRCIYTPTAA
jgi:5-formyltetrahydrofolate cyclo-ligase